MDFDRNSMNVPVQSSDYTKKSLQKDSNPTTMEVVTQTNAVKSPTDSPAATKLVYTVEEIARMLAISALPTTCATAPPNSVSCG